ncbi:hypothetical protein K438DRAFT_535695 [Mycena galopus ATCC 62051]|nr:hypothetical protein K438DRAFT_535695 [Mycena galopus ATCC 62051]
MLSKWHHDGLPCVSMLFLVILAVTWMQMGWAGGAHDGAIHALAQERWMHYLHRGADAGNAACHVQARYRPVCVKEGYAQPRADGRDMGAQVFRTKGNEADLAGVLWEKN